MVNKKRLDKTCRGVGTQTHHHRQLPKSIIILYINFGKATAAPSSPSTHPPTQNFSSIYNIKKHIKLVDHK